ncbi:Uncharacterized protein ChrSV_3134 [Chromobacterium vaccinii]|nr:Uncharacterized protein ChrSW_3134 [Chromobacterium vaccinii]QND90591.1 Uncharacterized protein ChrSV_3134 [Chromobacterium vaccinii]
MNFHCGEIYNQYVVKSEYPEILAIHKKTRGGQMQMNRIFNIAAWRHLLS